MKKILNIYVKINLILFPIFFLPFVQGAFSFGKNWFLLISALIGLIIWILSLLTQPNSKINFGRGFGYLFALTIWSFISWTKLSPSIKTSSLSEPYGLTTFVSLLLWYFLWLQSPSAKFDWTSKLKFLNISAIVISITSLIVFLLPDSSMPLAIPSTDPLLVLSRSFSLTGSLMAEVALMLFLVFENGRILVKSKKTAQPSRNIFKMAEVALFFLALSLGVYKMVKFSWVHLDYKTSWLIAADTFKNAPLFGAGIGNFLQAFNLFRPNTYNLLANWNQRFVISSSGFLHYWTELGLVFLLLSFLFLNKVIKQPKTNPIYWSLLLLVVINMLLPPSLVTLWLLTLYMSHKFTSVKSVQARFVVGEQLFNVVPLLTAVLTFTVVIGGFYISTKKLIARVYLKNSLVAASKNDGSATYNLQIKAIAADPNWAESRRLYSQTNIGLAQSLSQQEDLSDEDKEKISLLMQQSIREAKNAVNLDSASTIYWTNLGDIYKNLAGSVEGAADYAVQSYQQAAILDPADPIIRMDLGSLYFAATQYENAERVFEEAVVRKNNYANAWYNWAHAAKKLNKLADAVQRLSQAVSLVPIDSGDYESANGELLAWKQELDEAIKRAQQSQQQSQPKPAETLTQPEPLPTVSQEEVVNIPADDLQPPAIPTVEPTEPAVEPTQEALPTEEVAQP